MRLVFLILLLLNAIYFGWQHYLPVGNSEDSFISSDPGLEKLVLLHEVKQSPGKKAEGKKRSSVPVLSSTPEPVPEQMPDSVSNQSGEQVIDQVKVMKKPEEVERPAPKERLVCYKVGPYKSNDEARRMLDLLKADVKKVELIVKPRKVYKYWVFLSSQKSLKAAKQTVKQLASKGIKDYQILTIAGKKNGISLGLFREKEIAELRVKNIKRLGFAPEISSIDNEGSGHWLKVVINQSDSRQQEKLNIIPRGIVSQTSCVQ